MKSESIFNDTAKGSENEVYRKYSEIIEHINADIEFLKNERDFAITKRDEISKSVTLTSKNIDELVAEWLKIIEKIEEELNNFCYLKKEINTLYQNECVIRKN